MTKKLLSGLRGELIRPILYKCVTKCAFALTAVLLWNRYLNRSGTLRLSDGSFAAGLVLLALAWVSYLRADGMKFHYLLEERRKKRHSTSDLADFVDEHIVSFDELSREEQILCSFTANLVSGLLFILPSLVELLL